MRFENSFSVEAPPDEVFATMLDLEKVAPAMPGASVTEKSDDDSYKVAIKVKVGPMTMNYKGDVEIRDKDPDGHRATMHVKAREARGQGNATADVTTARPSARRRKASRPPRRLPRRQRSRATRTMSSTQAVWPLRSRRTGCASRARSR